MELVDQLLAILAGPKPRYATPAEVPATLRMRSEARGTSHGPPGYRESSGLGSDRLTAAGKARAADIQG